VQLALLSDVHANLEALQAVLGDLDRRAPEARLVCSGDVVGYGPDPQACIETLRARGAVFVMGNHEEMVLGRRDFSRCVYAGIVAALRTREALSLDAWEFLGGLPPWIEAAPGVVVCHGDLSSADTYVSTSARASQALGQLRSVRPQARLLVCGHTHHATFFTAAEGFVAAAPGRELVLPREEACVINPGAVGQAREGGPQARYALLDLLRGVVAFRALGYDHATTVRKLRSLRLVPQVVLLPPTGIARYVERLRARWARLRAARRRVPDQNRRFTATK
jgi:predicted phosphodiesterase